MKTNKTACWVVALSTFFTSVARGNEYLDVTVKTVESMHSLAEQEASMAFNVALFSYQDAFQSVVDSVPVNIENFNYLVNFVINPLVGQIKDNIDTYDLNGYSTVLKAYYQLQGLRSAIASYKDYLSLVQGWSNKNPTTEVLSNFCETHVPLLDIKNVQVFPMNSVVPELQYTKYTSLLNPDGNKSGGVFSADPAVDAIALPTLPVAVAGSLIAYSVTTGTPLLSLLGAGATTSGAAISMTGPAAIILVGVLAFVTLGSWIATEIRDENNRKRAEERIKKLQADFAEAKAYYDANSIKQEEYLEIGKKACDGLTNTVEKLKKSYVDNYASFLLQYNDFIAQYDSLQKSITSIDSLVVSYEKQLNTAIASSMLDASRQQALVEANKQAAITQYNIQIKPILGQFNALYRSSPQCATLSIEQGKYLGLINTNKDIIYSQVLSTEIPAVTKGIDYLTKRIQESNTCVNQQGGEIYDF